MFAKTIGWSPSQVRPLPQLADLEQLARRGLAEARKAAHDLQPLLEQTQEKVTVWAIAAGEKAARLVREQLDKKFNTSKVLVAAIEEQNISLAKPGSQAVASVAIRRGPRLLSISRLILRLLVMAVAEKAHPASAPAPGAKPKSPWLISRKDDLTFLIGSSAVSYFFMALLFIFKVKPSTVFWLYVLIFDGPHIFGTFSRTYADPEEWQKRRKLFLASLLWFVPGPVMVRLGLGDYFDIFAYVWAYYHLVKQHYGFSVLYKKKNNDLAKIDNYLDKALIWTGFTLPYVQFLFGPNYPTGYLKLSEVLPAWTPKLAAAAFFTTLTAYLGRQAYKLATKKPINTPKQLLLASSIGMHMVTFQLPFASLGGGLYSLAAIVATLTVYHNVQYDRLIWFHNRNKYIKGAQEGQGFGLASVLSKNLPRFAICGLLFGAAYRIPIGQLSQGRWGVSRQTGKYIGAFGWGFAFVHYYLDSKIWRVRHDARLNKALQTGPAAG